MCVVCAGSIVIGVEHGAVSEARVVTADRIESEFQKPNKRSIGSAVNVKTILVAREISEFVRVIS